ncbi:Phage terminase-like protein, large subunit, contains N-terminal HTH domain [Micromonospora sediminicola]|uniref:Phage terminase-like protein, large subunit, contains N-terminal HTH domain n=1 Tax=Micromonospora sediminicola TaxID=946078 RepID=A0A1A9B496_9ACTN|nr:terminase [Micromonospora sediminicola]SBT63938.1 Phage terminase-like protein, large subunit, contains N-terminal HTH domain [Micromonospora sediminicola]
MSVFVVPPLDEQPWPSLGPQLCDFLEERAVHGPGDLRGRPAVIDQEKRALIYRAYEVFPRGHPRAGRRRFKRVAWSLRKGVAKTELAAWVAYGELHPEAPVRTDGWKLVDGIWQPVGAPVTDPYIPMLAYTEEQTEELAYGALLFIVQEGPDADLFDAGKDHITRIDGEGKALAVAGSPSAADGARTTHQHFDETHRMILPRLKDARQTMRNNLPKRVLADAWELETTTTYGEGQGSCAEDTHQYAEMIAAGKVKDASLFFFHREAPWRDDEDLDDPEQLKAAIREASGPAIALWPDFEGQVESIASLYHQPDTDKMYWQRVWLNRRRSAERNAFDAARWTKTLARPAIRIEHGEPITIGFDGARWRDAVGFIATHIETGFQWPLRYWVRPDDAEGWEVTDDDVDGVLTEAMDLYAVRLVYADPPRFESAVARWSGRYGERRVLEWYTNRPRQIGQAMRAYRTAQTSGELTHNGDKTYADHIGNAVRGDLNVRDDDETPLWTIYKIRPDSTKYIDLAMAGCLSWKARLDAIAKGGWKRKKRKQIIVRR